MENGKFAGLEPIKGLTKKWKTKMKNFMTEHWIVKKEKSGENIIKYKNIWIQQESKDPSVLL